MESVFEEDQILKSSDEILLLQLIEHNFSEVVHSFENDKIAALLRFISLYLCIWQSVQS